MTISPQPQRALVLSYSTIASDPRVRRQIDWLAGDGWQVDTVGFGEHPADEVHAHFVLEEPPAWSASRWGTLIAHLTRSHRAKFHALVRDRIPAQVREGVRAGAYDLVVFNEPEFTPWIEDRDDFTAAALAGRRHLDLHEFHNPRRRRANLGGRITAPYYRWIRRRIGSPLFTSRSVVNTPIGKLYADEFGIPVPVEVRNAPPFVADLEPSPVDDREIRLLFHGLPSWSRGFSEILGAMRELPERFSMTFMLTANPAVHAHLREEIAAHPAKDRIHIVPPAPMRELAQRINPYDLEIVFYKPNGTPNIQFAMPNKFFEAAQGRIGVIVGETATMAPLVREFGHGVVVPEFTVESLRDTLAALTAGEVSQMKERAKTVAASINAESEGRAFLGAIAGPTGAAV